MKWDEFLYVVHGETVTTIKITTTTITLVILCVWGGGWEHLRSTFLANVKYVIQDQVCNTASGTQSSNPVLFTRVTVVYTDFQKYSFNKGRLVALPSIFPFSSPRPLVASPFLCVCVCVTCLGYKWGHAYSSVSGLFFSACCPLFQDHPSQCQRGGQWCFRHLGFLVLLGVLLWREIIFPILQTWN